MEKFGKSHPRPHSYLSNLLRNRPLAARKFYVRNRRYAFNLGASGTWKILANASFIIIWDATRCHQAPRQPRREAANHPDLSTNRPAGYA